MDYSIHTKRYEGPMDLLLDLIGKNKINISEISIVEITNQFVDYVNKMDKFDLELASDFIEMASKLLEMKSKYMLYVKNENLEETDPTEDLIKYIEEYKLYKEFTESIKDNITEYDNKYYRVKEEYYVDSELDTSLITLEALKSLLNKIFISEDEFEVESNYESNESLNTIVKNNIIHIEKKIEIIRDRLNDSKQVNFEDIIDRKNKSDIIANFLAMLELVKLKEIVIKQNGQNQDIIIQKLEV